MDSPDRKEEGDVLPCPYPPAKVRIERYRNTRYWAVWLDRELLAVTVYKKGAVAVRDVLCEILQGEGG
jgi:hypothetical protein